MDEEDEEDGSENWCDPRIEELREQFVEWIKYLPNQHLPIISYTNKYEENEDPKTVLMAIKGLTFRDGSGLDIQSFKNNRFDQELLNLLDESLSSLKNITIIKLNMENCNINMAGAEQIANMIEHLVSNGVKQIYMNLKNNELIEGTGNNKGIESMLKALSNANIPIKDKAKAAKIAKLDDNNSDGPYIVINYNTYPFVLDRWIFAEPGHDGDFTMQNPSDRFQETSVKEVRLLLDKFEIEYFDPERDDSRYENYARLKLDDICLCPKGYPNSVLIIGKFISYGNPDYDPPWEPA